MASIAAMTVFAFAPSTAAQAPTRCPARVELLGDAATIAGVSVELRRSGVEIGPALADCPAVIARVEADDGGGIAVAVTDGSHRSEGRVVSDAAIASTWIESWVRDDLDGSGWLLATPRARPLAAPVPARRIAAAEGPPHVELVSPPVGSRIERIGLAAGYEQSWTDDGTAATGFTAAACLRIGRACIGPRARYAHDAERVVGATAMARSDAELAAIATTWFDAGRITFAPEAGLGAGLRTTHRIEICPAPPASCMPGDPACTDPIGMPPPPADCLGPNKPYVGDGLRVRTLTPRLAAGLRIEVPLFDHVWLEGIASASFAPFGHASPFTRTDPVSGVPQAPLTLPGEPSGAFHLAVGLHVGAR